MSDPQRSAPLSWASAGAFRRHFWQPPRAHGDVITHVQSRVSLVVSRQPPPRQSSPTVPLSMAHLFRAERPPVDTPTSMTTPTTSRSEPRTSKPTSAADSHR